MSDSQSYSVGARLRVIEDKLSIMELIASHPPSADTGYADYTASVYMNDAVFDRGASLDGAQGSEAIAAFIRRPEHVKALRSGLAHFAGLPLIDLKGDRAVVTSYLLLLYIDEKGERRYLANHGSSSGYRVHRVLVNRWELERRNNTWKIRRRKLLPVDGTDAPRTLLSEGLRAFTDKGTPQSSDKNE